jgi:hypothetical protein
MGGDWRRGFEYAWHTPDPKPDEGSGLAWRETGANYWSGSSGTQPRGTVMLESSTGQWVAYVRLKDPPGLSPITTIAGGTATTCTPSGRTERVSVAIRNSPGAVRVVPADGQR